MTYRAPSDGNRRWPLLATVAIAFPALIAFNVPPSATFFNQAAAFVGWGVFLLLVTAELSRVRLPGAAGMNAFLGAMGLLVLAVAASLCWAALPASLAWSSAGTLLATALVFVVAVAAVSEGRGGAAFRALSMGLLIAGLASAVIGVIEVYMPTWTDGNWIALSSMAGRAVGNLRQPNHLSSLLLWALVATLWLGESRNVSWRIATPAVALMMFVVVLSGSRTGALGTLTLAGWGLLDRRLSRRTRWLLVLAPLFYAVMWAGAAGWAHLQHETFGGETRFSVSGDISSSRFAIWSNTLALIRAHPWLGVGFGEFNFAWTLTPFPDRPVAFFDHTHNLPLQFAVELGVPLALLVLGLLGWALVGATREAIAGGRDESGDGPPFQKAALVMVIMVVVHSMLEYPLWYSYFLLPTAFAFGLCIGKPEAGRVDPPRSSAFNAHPTRPLVIASMLLILGGMLSFYDYLRVVPIFSPSARAAPLSQRIVEGQHSWLFSPHADYAAVTTAEHPSTAMAGFKGATHYLLDARLMMAWATALDEAGDTDRARYIAARLKEFHNDQAAAFFAVCDEVPVEPKAASASQPSAASKAVPHRLVPLSAPAAIASGKRPFQCEAPQRSYTYLDFR